MTQTINGERKVITVQQLPQSIASKPLFSLKMNQKPNQQQQQSSSSEQDYIIQRVVMTNQELEDFLVHQYQQQSDYAESKVEQIEMIQISSSQDQYESASQMDQYSVVTSQLVQQSTILVPYELSSQSNLPIDDDIYEQSEYSMAQQQQQVVQNEVSSDFVDEKSQSEGESIQFDGQEEQSNGDEYQLNDGFLVEDHSSESESESYQPAKKTKKIVKVSNLQREKRKKQLQKELKEIKKAEKSERKQDNEQNSVAKRLRSRKFILDSDEESSQK